jgi:hypothetical protein
MDTKYFQQALDEFAAVLPTKTLSNLTMAQISGLLRRAQELKDAHHTQEIKNSNHPNLCACVDCMATGKKFS